MADWFRWWHGTVTDPKLGTVARKAGVRRGDAIAVLVCLLEHASQQKKRGDVSSFDVGRCADVLEVERSIVIAVIAAMEGRFVESGRVIERRGRPIFVQAPDGRLPLSEWKVVRARIFQRDDFTCRYCGVRGVKLECDHVIPISQGGGNEDENLVAACRPCNRSKWAKTPEQWRGR